LKNSLEGFKKDRIFYFRRLRPGPTYHIMMGNQVFIPADKLPKNSFETIARHRLPQRFVNRKKKAGRGYGLMPKSERKKII